MPNVVELLKELIKIPSDNPGNFEEDIASFIASILDKYKIEYKIVYAAKKRANVIGHLYGKSDRTLILCGHLDTKPPDPIEEWKTNPFVPTIIDDKLYGLGAADMKGGLAAMLAAVLDSSTLHLSGTVNFLFVADEEMNSMYGLKYLIRHGYVTKGDFAIVGEPTNLKVATKSVGNTWITVKVKGRRVHAGVYWKGTNAIDVSMYIINRLMQLLGEFRKNDTFPNINVGRIVGGQHPGTVPDYCEFTIDIRFKTEYEKSLIVNNLKNIIKATADKYNCICSLEPFGGEEMPSWDLANLKLDVDKYLQYVKNSYINSIQREPEECTFGGGSDAGILISYLKVPTVIIGPGSLEQAHSPNEWVNLSEVVEAYSLYKELIKRWNTEIQA